MEEIKTTRNWVLTKNNWDKIKTFYNKNDAIDEAKDLASSNPECFYQVYELIKQFKAGKPPAKEYIIEDYVDKEYKEED